MVVKQPYIMLKITVDFAAMDALCQEWIVSLGHAGNLMIAEGSVLIKKRM
jgi:hypothetical protein